MVFLKCMHTLCNLCLTKLRQNTCPFCRTAFQDAFPKGNGIVNSLPRDTLRNSISTNEYTNIYGENLRVRTRRRRRRRHTTTDIIDTAHGSVVVETSVAFKQKERKKKPKFRKEKRRKAKWGRMNAHVRAGRMTSR